LPESSAISRYLREVDSYLHVRRDQRDRVLAEIEGHLQDAAAEHIRDGSGPEEAMRRAIALLGSPRDVASQFAPAHEPTRAIRGWRRWSPVLLPLVVLAAGVVLTGSNILYVTRNGTTRGGSEALRYSILYTSVVAALTGATLVAIRKGDRDAGWRRAAWGCAALPAIVVALSYAS
jgi:hypothetical protein